MISKRLNHITWSIARHITNTTRYRRTVRELSALSDRELHDLGIVRCDISRVARQAMERDSANA